MNFSSKKGLSITEVLIASILGVLVVGGTLKLFVDSQKATTLSLDNMSTTSSFDRIVKVLTKSLATDSKIMIASSANVVGRPEAGLPYSLPFFVSDVCRSLNSNTSSNPRCAQNYVMMFAKLGLAGAAGICVARPNELNIPSLQGLSAINPNARILVLDPGHSVYGQFSFSQNTGEIMSTALTRDGSTPTPVGTTQSEVGTSVTSAINLSQAMYLWIPPTAFGIRSVFDSNNQIITSLIDKSTANSVLPERCRPYMAPIPLDSSTGNSDPLIALAIEPLFIENITGARPTGTNPSNIVTYATNYLDSDIQLPTRMGPLDFKSLGFEPKFVTSSTSNTSTVDDFDFGISDCSFTGYNLSCESYPAKIGLSETQSFNAELSFSKRLGQDDLNITSYKLIRTFTTTTTGSTSANTGGITGYSTSSSSSSGTIITSLGDETCAAPTCRTLPIPSRLSNRLYDNISENEYTLSSNNYSLMKANHTRSLKLILRWLKDTKVQSKEVFIALP